MLLAISSAVGYILSPSIPKQGIMEQTYFEGEADVVSMPQVSQRGESCVLRTAQGRFFTFLPLTGRYAWGDRVWARGVIKPLSEGGDQYFLHKGVIGTFEPAGLPVTLKQGLHLWHIAIAVRQSFLRFSDAALGPDNSALLDALCFNVTAELNREFLDALSRTGTIHIISTSGIHVVVVGVALAWALRLLPIPRWSQLALLTALLLLYAGAAGLRSPCIRAGMMCMAFSMAYWLRREPDHLSALALSAIPFLALAPDSIYDIGFQLSFITVGSLVLFLGPVSLNIRGPRAWVKRAISLAVMTSVVASIASAPLIAYHFGFVSLVSIPANLLVELPVTVLVPLGLLAWALSGIATAFSTGLMQLLVDPLLNTIKFVVEAVGGPWSAVNVPPFSAWWVLVCYTLLVMLWKPRLRDA